MTKKLPRQGNSTVLRITKEMREYIGVSDSDEVDVDYSNGKIIIGRAMPTKRPTTIEGAAEMTEQQFGNALRILAQ